MEVHHPFFYYERRHAGYDEIFLATIEHSMKLPIARHGESSRKEGFVDHRQLMMKRSTSVWILFLDVWESHDFFACSMRFLSSFFIVATVSA